MGKILTQPADPTEQVVGYWINTAVSDAVAQVVAELQAELEDRFQNAIWNVPRDALHISFNALTPFYEVGQVSQAPRTLPSSYGETFQGLLRNVPPIKLHFDSIEVSPAAIFLKATDDGSFQRLREEFCQRVQLPAGTKASPTIIHTTIAKFRKAIPLDEVQKFVGHKTVAVDMAVSEFRIVRETTIFMVEFETLQHFRLA